MINSRDIAELHPTVRKMAEEFIAKCKAAGIDVLITSTYRDNESQNALYAQGRTKKGAKVTNAKGGQSYHNWRVAFDFVPIVNGKADWNNLKTFERCGVIGESCGLEWAGRWKSFKEYAHLQYTGGLKLADFQSGKTLSN
jgi:peptidoglycan L-alanyl-D-glutamate endopeptidase CwlK